MSRVVKAKTYTADPLAAERMRLRAYACERESRGCPALPCNPKNSREIGIQQISDETNISYNILRRLSRELNAIHQTSVIAALPPKQAEALAAIRRIYANRTVPVTRYGNMALEQVSRETSITVGALKSPGVRAALAELRQRNGDDVITPLTITEEIRRISALADALRASGEPLPWRHSHATPNYAEIARRTGVDCERLKNKAIKAKCQRLFQGIAPEARESKSDEQTRLAAFVDVAVGAGNKVPVTCKGLAWEKIAHTVAIPAHRLRLRHLRSEIDRWKARCLPDLVAKSEVEAPRETS